MVSGEDLTYSAFYTAVYMVSNERTQQVVSIRDEPNLTSKLQQSLSLISHHPLTTYLLPTHYVPARRC